MPRILVLPVLVLALAAAVPSDAAQPPDRIECSPIPHVVHLECLDLPGAGAVAMTHVPGAGVTVTPTAGLTCTPATVVGNTATTTCMPLAATATVCLDPHAFAAASHLTATLTATADCGTSPATCSTSLFPNNFCFSPPTLGNAGTYPLNCKAEIQPPATIGGFVWWVQCSSPV